MVFDHLIFFCLNAVRRRDPKEVLLGGWETLASVGWKQTSNLAGQSQSAGGPSKTMQADEHAGGSRSLCKGSDVLLVCFR